MNLHWATRTVSLIYLTAVLTWVWVFLLGINPSQEPSKEEKSSTKQFRGRNFLPGQTPAGQPQTKAADQVKAQPKPAETKPAVPLPLIALVEANIKTMDDAGEFVGTILIEGDRIKAVGKTVEIPATAKKIDCKGLTIVPGFIDASSSAFLDSSAVNDGGGDGSLDIMDAVDSFTTDWKDLAREGITAVYVEPGRGGALGGKGALLKVAPAGTPEQLKLRYGAFQSAIGGAPTTIARFGQYSAVKGNFESVKKYADEWKKYDEDLKKYQEAKKKEEEAKKKGADPSVKKDETKKEEKPAEKKPEGSPPSPEGRPRRQLTPEQLAEMKKQWDRLPPEVKKRVRLPPGVDFDRPAGDAPQKKDETKKEEAKKDETKKDETKKEEPKAESKPAEAKLVEPKKPKKEKSKDRLVGLVNGSDRMRIHVAKDEEIQLALKLMNELKLKGEIAGITEPGESLEQLKKQRVGLILGPFRASDRMNDKSRDWLKQIFADDMTWAIGTFGSNWADSRQLRHHAAEAIAMGAKPDQVLRALTKDSARLLGAGDLLGTIAPGRLASIAGFAGDPLDPSVAPSIVISAGEVLLNHTAGRKPVVGELPAPIKKVDLASGNSLEVIGDEQITGSWTSMIRQTKAAAASPTDPQQQILQILQGGGGGPDSGVPDSARGYLRSVDSFDPSSALAKSAMQQGAGFALVLPEGAEVEAGTVGSVRLNDGLAINPDLGMFFNLSAEARNRNRYPAHLAGQVDVIRSALKQAPVNSRLFAPDEVRNVLAKDRLERLQRALAGSGDKQSQTFIMAQTRLELQAALDLIEEFKLKGVIVGAVEYETVIDRLKDQKVAVIVGPLAESASRKQIDTLKSLLESGTRVAIATTTAEQRRQTAALLLAAGTNRLTVYHALYRNLGEIAGLADQPSKPGAHNHADAVIWTGSPIDARARVKRVILDGKEVKP